MRQLINKEAYEAPLTTKRVVTMEGNCMAASGEKIIPEEKNVDLNTTNQIGGNEFGVDGDWN